MHPQELYLDLLIRALVNTLYGDPNIDHWHDRVFDPALREEGKDWPRDAHTMVGLARLRNLRDLAERCLAEGVPGDFIETGIWRGGCCILLRGLLAAHGDPSRRLYAADPFRGLPPASGRYPADIGDALHTFDDLAVSLDTVQANFARYGLLDDRTVFLEGLFQDTLPQLHGERFALIRLDGDMYESTIVALDHLYPQLSPGGYVIIDDYGAIAACRQAVTDFRSRYGIDTEINRVDWTGVWWRKPIARGPLGIALSIARKGKIRPTEILEGWLGKRRSRRS
jgi:O-methyltransferase